MLETSGAEHGFSPLLCKPVQALPSLPTAKVLVGPLIDTLGLLSDYRPRIGVPMGDVLYPTLIRAGIDPETHPLVVSGHWLITGGGKHDLKTKVGFAFRNKRSKYCGKATPLTVQIGTGLWGLTDAGVELAINRRSESDHDWKGPRWTRNHTSEWFDVHGVDMVLQMDALASMLGLGDLKESFTRDLRSVVACDGLRPVLEAGLLPRPIDLVERVVGDLPEAPPLPKPTSMSNAVITALCETTGFRAGLGVDPCPNLYNAVLKEFGVDTESHPLVIAGLWDLKGKGGLYRKVQHAMKWQADTPAKTCKSCREKITLALVSDEGQQCPSCAAPVPLAYPRSREFTTLVKESGKRPQWALTPEGVSAGINAQRGAMSPTAFWLSRSGVPQVLSELLQGRFRRISRERLEHLRGLFLAQLTEEDALSEELLSGTPPTDQEIIDRCFLFVKARANKANTTAGWFAVDTASKMSLIKSRMGAALAKSRNLGEIDDLAHEFVADIIRRDGIATYRAKHPGRNVTPRMVANWAINSAYSHFRDAAKDCHGREFRNARSKNERAARAILKTPSRSEEWGEAKSYLHAQAGRHSPASPQVPVHLTANAEGQQDFSAQSMWSGHAPLVDVVGSTGCEEEKIIHEMDRQRGLAKIERAIRDHKPGAPDRYVGIFRYVAGVDAVDGRYIKDSTKGLNCREIAAREGVQRNRAASLTQDMRTALRSSKAASERALNILSYIEEEPFSTECDLRADLGLEFSDIVKALSQLLGRGYVDKTEGSGSESSYTLTTIGETLVREANDPELGQDLYHRLFA